MTEQEAHAIINEIRTENPSKRQGQTLYQLNTKLQRKGLPCVETYRLTKSGKRAIFERIDTIDNAARYAHPDVRAWLENRR